MARNDVWYQCRTCGRQLPYVEGEPAPYCGKTRCVPTSASTPEPLTLRVIFQFFNWLVLG